MILLIVVILLNIKPSYCQCRETASQFILGYLLPRVLECLVSEFIAVAKN